MNRSLLLTVFLLSFCAATAQTIQVLESDSQEPIPGVAVYNTGKSKSGVTDFDGMVDISAFSENEVIFFQHISHLKTSVTKSKIIASDNKVYMTTDASSLEEVVLSVSKFGLKKKELPQQIVTVTSEDIQ
ncbi:carboxypeptidase-like regulatory domain-containing protein, partial [Altibacter sp.]|nr:carboxypeptidase-like regulatory domain-containing protein [Altibacter sp.]